MLRGPIRGLPYEARARTGGAGLRRLLYALAGLAVLAVVGIIALPFVLSPAFIAGKLSAAVEQATGRVLVMGSAPRLSLWPEIAVEIDNVVLGNPPGMFEGRFASVDKLKLRIGIKPLLQRRLDIRELTLVRPRIGLIVDGEGRSNWSFDAGGKAARTDKGGDVAAAGGVALAPVVIEDGDIRYLDERSGTALAIEHVDLTVNAPRLNGPVALKGYVTWKNQRLGLDFYAKAPERLVGEGSPVDLNIDGALIDVSFDGLTRLNAGLGLAGTVEMKTPSLRDLAQWAGKPLAPGGGLRDFSVKGALDLTGAVITLKNAAVGLDGMKAKGNLTIDTGGKRPSVVASLDLDRLNVNTYLGAPAPTAPAGTPGVDEWSAARIDLSGLSAVDATLALAADAIAYRDMNIGKTRIDATLKDGRLIARLTEMAFYDGKATGEIVLSSGGGDAVLQGRLSAGGLDGYRLLKDFAGIERIAGEANLSLALAARGKSQRELVSTLNGAAAFRFTNGAIRGINIAAMIRNVSSGILTGWDTTQSKDTDFALLEANYKIADGVATNDDLKLAGPQVRMTAKGSVDLLRRRLDYKAEPKLVATLQGQGGTAKLTGLPVPVVVEGPWVDPRIYPDIKGMLQDPKAAYEALRKMSGLGENIDLKAKAAKIGDKVKAKADQVTGGEAAKTLGDKGNSLINGLLNKSKPAADAAQQQPTQ